MNPNELPKSEDNVESLKVVIEKATIADLETIQRLNQELCLKENHDFDSTINPDYSLSKAGAEYFTSRIESSDGFAIVAKEGGEYVGYLVGGMVEPEDYRTVKSVAELENMYVRESMRGKGIGGAWYNSLKTGVKKKAWKSFVSLLQLAMLARSSFMRHMALNQQALLWRKI